MGNKEKDLDPIIAHRAGIGKVGGWIAGRGSLPGHPPSTAPAGDGRPCTYHDMVEVPYAVFVQHCAGAEFSDPLEWALDAPEPLKTWLLALPADELVMAHQQAVQVGQ